MRTTILQGKPGNKYNVILYSLLVTTCLGFKNLYIYIPSSFLRDLQTAIHFIIHIIFYICFCLRTFFLSQGCCSLNFVLIKAQSYFLRESHFYTPRLLKEATHLFLIWLRQHFFPGTEVWEIRTVQKEQNNCLNDEVVCFFFKINNANLLGNLNCFWITREIRIFSTSSFLLQCI